MNCGSKIFALVLASFMALNTAFASPQRAEDEALLIPGKSPEKAFRIKMNMGLMTVEDCSVSLDTLTDCKVMTAGLNQRDRDEVSKNIDDLIGSQREDAVVAAIARTSVGFAGMIAAGIVAYVLGVDGGTILKVGAMSCAFVTPIGGGVVQGLTQRQYRERAEALPEARDMIANGECKTLVLENVNYSMLRSALDKVLVVEND